MPKSAKSFGFEHIEYYACSVKTMFPQHSQKFSLEFPRISLALLISNTL